MRLSVISDQCRGSELGACGYKSLSCFIVFKLLEVVDEHFGELGGFSIPFFNVGVSVARVKNFGIYAGEFGGYGEVEDGELLGGGLQDRAVKDRVDDAAGILDGYTLACAVPAGVDQICLGAAFFHFLHEFFGILGGVQRKECCAEACRECGGGLGDAAFGTGEFGSKAGKEVVLGLLGIEDRYGRKHTECVGRKEYYILGSGAARGLNDALDVVDGVGYAGVLGN